METFRSLVIWERLKKNRRHTQVLLGWGAIKLLLWTLGHFSLFFVNTGRKNPEWKRGKRTRAFFKKKKGSSRRPTLSDSVKLFFRPIELTLVLLWRNSQTERVASIKVTSPLEKLENKWGEMLEQQQQQPRRYNNSRHICKKKSCCHPKKEEGLSCAIRIDCLFLLL